VSWLANGKRKSRKTAKYRAAMRTVAEAVNAGHQGDDMFNATPFRKAVEFEEVEQRADAILSQVLEDDCADAVTLYDQPSLPEISPCAPTRRRRSNKTATEPEQTQKRARSRRSTAANKPPSEPNKSNFEAGTAVKRKQKELGLDGELFKTPDLLARGKPARQAPADVYLENFRRRMAQKTPQPLAEDNAESCDDDYQRPSRSRTGLAGQSRRTLRDGIRSDGLHASGARALAKVRRTQQEADDFFAALEGDAEAAFSDAEAQADLYFSD